MRRGTLAVLACGLLSCGPSTHPSGPAPSRSPVDSIPIPAVQGPIVLDVRYPAQDGTIDVRDSTFLLGTTGTGAASLTINGSPVRVLPNGAWLAWVAVPPDSVIRFELVARTTHDSVTLVRTVRRARPLLAHDALTLDPASFAPKGAVWVGSGERMTLKVRATPGAAASLVLPSGRRVLMVEEKADDVPWGIRAFDSEPANLMRRGAGATYVTSLTGSDIDAGPRGLFEPMPSGSMSMAAVELIRGGDTLRAPWPLMVATLDTLPSIVRLDDDSAHTGKTDSTTVGRTVPGGTYYWFFRTGTVARATGRINDELRLGLSNGTTAWVNVADARSLPAGTPVPMGQVGSMVVSPTVAGQELRIPVRTRIPVGITETESAIVLTFHGALGDADWTRYRAAPHASIHRVDWLQDEDRVVVTVETAPLWGYRSRWDGTDFLLEVRSAPAIDRAAPLRGRTIAIDPGHPPAGTTGPSGYREAEANLAISLRLAGMLEREGARVILTRRDDSPLELNPRIAIAEAEGAELLVSIHNNALPDGVNPFTNHGTSVFYNHAQSLPFARAVQSALVARLGLRDLGVARGDLAMVRPTWQPSILTEGVHLIVPEQEAALRTAEGQDRYARGVLEGIHAFLAGTPAARCEIPGC